MRIIILSISSHMTEDEDETFRAYADSITGIFAADDEIDEMDKALAIADTPYTQDTVNFLPGKMPDLHMLSQMVCLLSEFFRLNEHSGQGFTNAKKPGSWDQNLTTPHQAVILKVARALPVDGEPPYMVTEVTAGLGS